MSGSDPTEEQQPPSNGDVKDPSSVVRPPPPEKTPGTSELRERANIDPRRKLEEFVHELCYAMTHILRRADRVKGRGNGQLTEDGRKDLALVKTMMNNGRIYIEACFKQEMPGAQPPDVPRKPGVGAPATSVDVTAAIQDSKLDPLEDD